MKTKKDFSFLFSFRFQLLAFFLSWSHIYCGRNPKEIPLLPSPSSPPSNPRPTGSIGLIFQEYQWTIQELVDQSKENWDKTILKELENPSDPVTPSWLTKNARKNLYANKKKIFEKGRKRLTAFLKQPFHASNSDLYEGKKISLLRYRGVTGTEIKPKKISFTAGTPLLPPEAFRDWMNYSGLPPTKIGLIDSNDAKYLSSMRSSLNDKSTPQVTFVDFANFYLGGSWAGVGNVQEEQMAQHIGDRYFLCIFI